MAAPEPGSGQQAAGKQDKTQQGRGQQPAGQEETGYHNKRLKQEKSQQAAAQKRARLAGAVLLRVPGRLVHCLACTRVMVARQPHAPGTAQRARCCRDACNKCRGPDSRGFTCCDEGRKK
jgi:hypothetical protein